MPGVVRLPLNLFPAATKFWSAWLLVDVLISVVAMVVAGELPPELACWRLVRPFRPGEVGPKFREPENPPCVVVVTRLVALLNRLPLLLLYAERVAGKGPVEGVLIP